MIVADDANCMYDMHDAWYVHCVRCVLHVLYVRYQQINLMQNLVQKYMCTGTDNLGGPSLRFGI